MGFKFYPQFKKKILYKKKLLTIHKVSGIYMSVCIDMCVLCLCNMDGSYKILPLKSKLSVSLMG